MITLLSHREEMESFAVLDPSCLLLLETTPADDTAHHKQNNFHVSIRQYVLYPHDTKCLISLLLVMSS